MLRLNQLIGFGARNRRSGLFHVADLLKIAADSGNTIGEVAVDAALVIAILTFEDDSAKLPTGLSVGGVAMTQNVVTASAVTGVSIFTHAGPMAGPVVWTVSGSGGTADLAATFLGLNVPGTISVIDTDTGTTSLGALSSPGANGYRIAGSCDASTGAQTWTGVTAELVDITGGNGDYRHSVAYHQAASSASIGNASAEKMAGISVSIS